ncbi:hypothetical protein ACTXT7_008740 [Hymenolepis weldensis]
MLEERVGPNLPNSSNSGRTPKPRPRSSLKLAASAIDLSPSPMPNGTSYALLNPKSAPPLHLPDSSPPAQGRISRRASRLSVAPFGSTHSHSQDVPYALPNPKSTPLLQLPDSSPPAQGHVIRPVSRLSLVPGALRPQTPRAQSQGSSTPARGGGYFSRLNVLEDVK